MSTLLTKECYNSLTEKLYELQHIEQPKLSNHIDECRSIGSLDDNPEYYQSLEEMDRLNKKIDELIVVLNDCTIFKKEMLIKDTVMFGTTVDFIDCDTEVKKQYTLCSVYDSDASLGKISVDSPFAKEMIGLHIGDYFTFRDKEYEIISICSSSL